MEGRKGGELCVSVSSVPAYFLCPISLDVMRSPVSLCTGITYDRSSIQRWLEQGHTTCPATMQHLPSTDLVPNLTLYRLISLWSPSTPSSLRRRHLQDLLRRLRTTTADDDQSTLVPSLRELADVLASGGENPEGLAPDCVAALNGVLVGGKGGKEATSLAVGVLATVLGKIGGGEGRGAVVRTLASTRTISALLGVITAAAKDPRTSALGVLESIASVDADSKTLVAETVGIIPELVRLVEADEDLTDLKTTESALACLLALSPARRVRSLIVDLGVVPRLGRLLSLHSLPVTAAEKALRLLETASTLPDGRAAICDSAAVVMPAAVGRMVRVSPAATEAAVAVLWRVCHQHRDRRAQAAAVGSGSVAMTRLLMVMQSGCSPAAREMAMDLLRMFRVHSKGCLKGCGSKTAHIMPF